MIPAQYNVHHVWNVFDARSSHMLRSSVGQTVADLAPVTNNPVICSVNGEFFKQDDWPLIEIVPESDLVIFHILPLGNGGAGQSIMAIVGVALIVYGSMTGQYNLTAYGVGLLVGGLVPLPTTGPVVSVSPQTEAQSPTYNTQLSGNTARLGKVLPVPYGRHIITPDFASQPYQFFGENDTQYYCALLSIGMMTHFRVESLLIGNTPVQQFEDFQIQYVGAGNTGGVPDVSPIASLSLVHPVVVTAPEVANQELVHTDYVGPFIACGPGAQIVKIGIDIICPNGLYYAADDGTLTSKSCTILIEYRRVNSLTGAPVGGWSLLGLETVTRTQNSPVRVSFEYTVVADRYQVRCSRQDIRDSNARAGHTVQWAGLRAFLNTPAPLDDAGNYLAIKIRATNQLSGLSQRKVSLIIQRWLASWSPTLGWVAPAYTRSIAWAALDVAKNSSYGLALPDANIDFATLYQLDQIWLARGDVFNAVFDERITGWDALAAVLRCGRARPIMRGAVLTFVRDQPQTLPTAIFSQHKNIQRDSFSVDYTLVTDDEVDGIEVAFYDERKWDTNYVRIPLPGNAESIAPKQVQIVGITNLKQAQRECAFHAAAMTWRRSVVALTTEMDGYLPPFGDMVGIIHDVMATGSSGFVEYWDGTVARGTESINWSAGDNYCVMTNNQGDVYGPAKVAAGPQDRTFVFVDPVPLNPYVGTEYERTIYAIGPANAWSKFIKLTAIRPAAGDTVSLSGFVDDPRVYDYDAPYTGIDYIEGDGGGTGGGGGGGGTGSRVAVYVADGYPSYTAASDAQRSPAGFYAGDDLTVNGDPPYTYS